MQKRMLLLLLMMSSFDVYTMEREASSSFFPLCLAWPTMQPVEGSNEGSGYFLPFCLYIPTWSKDNLVSLSPMQRIQKDKENFEERVRWNYDIFLDMMLVLQGWYSDEVFDSKPTEFLRYCYNLHNYSYPDGFVSLVNLEKNNSLHDKCKQARIDGYSALGAAMIAESVMYKDESVKHIFISKLKQMGFEFTQKDKELLALEIYNNILAKQKQSAILLMQLYKKTEGNFCVLPKDLMIFIVAYMVVFVISEASINTVGFVHLRI